MCQRNERQSLGHVALGSAAYGRTQRIAHLDITTPADASEISGVTYLECDVAEPNSVASAIGEVASRFGGIDAVVNNAGLLSGRSSLLEATPDDAPALQRERGGAAAPRNDEVFRKTMSAQVIQEFVSPEDFAGLVAFLAAPDATVITGQCLVCDGGGLSH